jgi:purine-cytosine permease-like protein
LAATTEKEIAMPVILWSILAVVLVLGVIAVARYHSRSILPPLVLPPGETLPTAPLQRLVRWSLALGVVPMAAAAVLVAWYGPTEYSADDAVRLLVTGLLLASLIVLAVPTLLASAWATRDDDRLDERDRAILARAPAGQAGAILVLLAVWVIALTETFRGEPGIPSVFLTLMFWSCLLVSLLASNVGILLGYRRS